MVSAKGQATMTAMKISAGAINPQANHASESPRLRAVLINVPSAILSPPTHSVHPFAPDRISVAYNNTKGRINCYLDNTNILKIRVTREYRRVFRQNFWSIAFFLRKWSYLNNTNLGRT